MGSSCEKIRTLIDKRIVTECQIMIAKLKQNPYVEYTHCQLGISKTKQTRICEILLMLKIIHRSLSTAVLRTFCQLVCDVVNDSILIMHKETTNTEGNFESRIK